jgi:hypothetical protein
MSFWDRFKKKTLEHSLFGRLVFNKYGWWDGDISFSPTGNEIGITIRASETGPTDISKERYEKLQKDYPALKPEIDSVLFNLYKKYTSEIKQEDFSNDFPHIDNPNEADKAFLLAGLEIDESSDVITLNYCFKPPCHEHGFDIYVGKDGVTGEYIGD